MMDSTSMRLRLDRVEILASHLESLPPELFDISVWGEDCGPPACIAGWAVRLAHPEFGSFPGGTPLPEVALDWLLANPDSVDDRFEVYFDLFSPDVPIRKVTPKIAAHALRTYAATGIADWGSATKACP